MSVAPDGSPVDLYLLLPARGQGCGFGRLLVRRLNERGSWVEARLYSGA